MAREPLDPEAEGERRRKAAIYSRHARAMDRLGVLRRWRRALKLPALAILGGITIPLALWLLSPYVPRALTTAHPATCAQARALGHGNARIGTAGYFAHLDRDGDGISCEPWFPNWRRP